jgi:hypothetical protein
MVALIFSASISSSAGRLLSGHANAGKTDFHSRVLPHSLFSDAHCPLEGDAKPQTNGSLAQHAFLRKAVGQLTEQRVDVDVAAGNRR